MHNNSSARYYNSIDDDKNLIGLWITIAIISTVLLFILVLLLLRCHFRGPLKGSNNASRLDDRTVAITGKISLTLLDQGKEGGDNSLW